MRLRPDAWEEIALSDDEEASASVSMIVALNDFYYGRSELTEEAEDELDRMAPGLIPEFVRNLNVWTKSRQNGTCLSMKLSKAAETQRMSHRGFQSLCHIRVRTVQLPPTSL